MDEDKETIERICRHFAPDFVELLRFLRSQNMKQTEACLRHECHSLVKALNMTDQSPHHSSFVEDYFAIYTCLSTFVLHSPFQLELTQLLFPLFVHLYLDLLEHDYINECQKFFAEFAHSTLISLNFELIRPLKLIARSSSHLRQCPLASALRHSRFFLRLSMTSCNELQNFIERAKVMTQTNSKCYLSPQQIALLLSIFQQYLKVDINQQFFTPSNVVRYRSEEEPMTPLFVHTTVASAIQFTQLYTGVFPSSALSFEQIEYHHLNKQDISMAKNITLSSHLQSEGSYRCGNAPRLGPHQLPSICLFTLKNSRQTINCVTLSTDCRLLAIGFRSSEILVCSLDANSKLYSMKSTKELNGSLAKSTRNAFLGSNQMNIDDVTSGTNATNERLLIGHTAAVFALAFEPNKQTYLLSGSEDCTVRLWHLSTWSCLIVYKMHFQPILDVTFAPFGHSFASCGADGLVCLWSTDKASPLRIYPEYGHSGPINLVEFHPNSYYLATAHNDHTVHLWNVNGDNRTSNNPLLRIFNGHRHPLSSLRFSPNGHLLASGCWNGELILWDIQHNAQIAHLIAHTSAICSLEFSPGAGTLLLAASLDATISLWNCFTITKTYDEKLTGANSLVKSSSDKILLNVFRTKNTPLSHIRFSRENILYAIGLFN